MRGAATAEGEEQEQLTRSQSVSFLRVLLFIEKVHMIVTVKLNFNPFIL